jgi:hypothetical protein
MFGVALPLPDEAELRGAADLAFGVLHRAAEAACATAPPGGCPPAPVVALHIWALAHGIASLFIGPGEAGRGRLPMSPEDLLAAGLRMYLQRLEIDG